MQYTRPLLQTLLARFREPRRLMQVLTGPRQVGKSTLARQLVERLGLPAHMAAADAPTLQTPAWIAQQWEAARLLARRGEALLVLDEVQKIPSWSELVKLQWDEDSATGLPLRLLLLGSAPLLIQQGLSESLAGRFELLHATHWSYPEMRHAFGWGVDRYIYFGGYPGAAHLVEEEQRWRRYILDSLVETSIARDVLLMNRIDKPALLRQLFHLACEYSGQILSYQKMTGQLQDAGNTTTLAHYLHLLAGAGMVTGLEKYAGERVRQRASSPKLLVYNTALLGSHLRTSFADTKSDPAAWGRLVESAVGAHLANGIIGTTTELTYWRDRNREVDFVLTEGGRLRAIEVKSGAPSTALPGIDAFTSTFGGRPLLVGSGGLTIEAFLSMEVKELMEAAA